MQCPNISELPLPPEGRVEWPWTVSSKRLPELMPDGSTWPTISIITPSLNQGKFIEETIRSVLLQNYPRIEYIIMDGGSTDGSLEIIERYAPWLHYWSSEPDRGQGHALNKGFSKATGDIYAYINSDDIYEPDAFRHIAHIFFGNDKPQFIAGSCVVIAGGQEKREFTPWWPDSLTYFLSQTFSSTFAQPASFWTKQIFEQVGGLDESFHYCFDREFFLRIGLEGHQPKLTFRRLARFREHPDSKSVESPIKFHEESIRMLKSYARVCRLSERKVKMYERRIQNEINYAKVFAEWKECGRKSAFVAFVNMILRAPHLLTERRILGQARRLVFFKEQDVAELQ